MYCFSLLLLLLLMIVYCFYAVLQYEGLFLTSFKHTVPVTTGRGTRNVNQPLTEDTVLSQINCKYKTLDLCLCSSVSCYSDDDYIHSE